MRNFLKNNALAILVCLVTVGTFASATTITRPYGASDYAGGTKAVGTKVNAEFASIVAWLNGGNISSENIATSGVATSNIASFAVTTAKIANQNVTFAKLEAPKISVTSSSSAYVLAESPTPATVTNLSTTFTASGRPITVALEPVPSSYQLEGVTYYDGYVSGSNNAATSALFFVRDGSTTAHFYLRPITVTGPLYDYRVYPCSSFRYTETALVQGEEYTFAVKVSTGVAAGDDAAFVYNCRLVVREW